MPSKPAKILARTETLRAEPRESVIISGKCQVGDRLAEEVLVTDLSTKGCRLRGNSIGVTKAERVQLWIGAVKGASFDIHYLVQDPVTRED